MKNGKDYADPRKFQHAGDEVSATELSRNLKSRGFLFERGETNKSRRKKICKMLRIVGAEREFSGEESEF